MKYNRFHRILALILMVVMVVSAVPSYALEADTEISTETVTEVTVEEETKTETEPETVAESEETAAEEIRPVNLTEESEIQTESANEETDTVETDFKEEAETHVSEDASTLQSSGGSETEKSEAKETETTDLDTETKAGSEVSLDVSETESTSEIIKAVRIQADATNAADTETRLYFWSLDTDSITLPDDPDVWSAYLTNALSIVEPEGLDDNDEIQLAVTLSDGTASIVTAQYIREYENNTLESVYLSFILPANAVMDTKLNIVVSDDAEIEDDIHLFMAAATYDDADTYLCGLSLVWDYDTLEETGIVKAQTETEVETEAETETDTETETETEDGAKADPEIETESESEAETETETETGTEAQSEETSSTKAFALAAALETEESTGDSYVSGFKVKSMTDGTASWDDDDKAGNDSSDSNYIVRSFDYINYNLEFTTALTDPTSVVDDGYLYIRFELDYDVSEVQFRTDTMNWVVDMEVTYVYEDGTESTTYDSSKKVTKQILTGKRHLTNTDGNNAIPGVGTLSVGLYVTGAANGTVIQPEFTVWMEDNDESQYQTIQAEKVTVSAAPKYNIEIKSSSTGTNILAYYNLDSGTISTSAASGSVYGRLEGYSITLQLYNDYADKGLKGIELPTGDIEFDLTINSYLNGVDYTNSSDYPAYLWDYYENGSLSSPYTGKLGRLMKYSSSFSYAYYATGNRGGSKSNTGYCYNGGTWSMAQTASNVYHVTVSSYAFDFTNFIFPSTYMTGITVVYGDNIGCFSCCFFEVLSQFPTSVSTTSSVYQKATASNLSVKSVSGAAGYDVLSSDDAVQTAITLYPTGALSQHQRYYSVNSSTGKAGTYLSSVEYAGDSTAYRGQDIYIQSSLQTKVEYSWHDFSVLQKFDDEGLEIADGTWYYYYNSTYMTDTGDVTMLFAAKPDKSGWTDDSEMMSTREEELIYFKTIGELENAGYTCVGVLWEVRGCENTYIAGASDIFVFYIKMHVKDDGYLPVQAILR